MPESAPALDYAPPPTARRRWMRRLRRGWPVGLLLVVAGLGIVCGPGIWRRWQVLRLQEACMTAEMPADRPVLEADPVPARALVAEWPGEYVLGSDGAAMRVDSRWAAMAGVLGVPTGGTFKPWFPATTGFCHERHTPDGRRLAVLDGWWYVTVIDPARWPVGGGPRVAQQDGVVWDMAARDALYTTDGLKGPNHIAAGVADPTDPARFTVPFVRDGIPGTWEYRLGNDDRVTMRLLDPAGFIARAKAAKARATTQP